MSFPTASGHQDLSAYVEPILSDQLLSRFSCESKFTEMATANYLEPLKTCGDTIRFLRLGGGQVRPYTKNQPLKPGKFGRDVVIVRDSKGAYYYIKMNDVDRKQICNADQMIDAYMKDTVHQLSQMIELDVLCNMIAGVDRQNMGQCAGAKSHCYNMGSLGAPLKVDCENFYKLLLLHAQVLREACAIDTGHGTTVCGPGNGGGEPFIMLPWKAYPIFIEGLSKGYCCDVKDSTPIITGRIPDKVHGFHLYFSHEVPWYEDCGEQVYHIVAGRRDATGFCITMDQSEKCRPCDDFADFYKGLTTWASGVIYPEALTRSAVCFDFDGDLALQK